MPRVTKYDENDEPISGYRLVNFLGAGQFGEVWKAIEPATGKLVAIKIIDLSHSNSALKELKALNLVKNLNHPNLIPIFTARVKDKNNREIPLNQTEALKGKGVLRELVIAMGLGDKSLSARLKEINPDGTDPQDFHGLPIDELLGYMQGAAKGIDFLNKQDHGLGAADGPIVHCDIKPDNMMIVAGEVQIVDCGVAVIITPDVRQTKAAGSPAYSAPELTGNKPVPGTDQYSLAISYYELRTGKLPFDEQMGQLSIMLAHAEGRLDFTSPIITDEERMVLKWGTAVRPKERYQSCADLVKQLERAVEGLPPLEPGKVVQRSGVVPTAKSRVAPPPPLDPSMLRSTPNLPTNPSYPARPPADPVVSFDLPETRDELRGTIIPDSDRLLSSTDSGLSLPTRPGSAAYGASQSDIEMPLGANDFPIDEEFDETGAPPVPPANKGKDISRPQISVDGNDPMGARAGSVELDPEIANIIKGSGATKAPSMRLPSHPSVQTQRPPSRPEIAPVPGHRSTEYPRETPAEEEAKSLPPWAKEAKAAEQRANRDSMPSLPTTNWKAAEADKPAGGKGAALVVGGVLAAGIAGLAGAYFGGVFGGGENASSSGGVVQKDSKVDSGANQGDPKKDNENSPPETVDERLIKPIDDLIAAKPGTDFNAAIARHEKAGEKIGELPKSSSYDGERDRLRARNVEYRKEIDAAIVNRAGEIDKKLAMVDPKDFANGMRNLSEVERLVAQLPSILPNAIANKRTEWSSRIDEHRSAMKISEDDRKFLATLQNLETLPVTSFSSQFKDIYAGTSTDTKRRELVGARLLDIGERKPEYRDAIIAFFAEDRGLFDRHLKAEADKQKFFDWRAAPVKKLADDLLAKLASLTTGKAMKETFDAIKTDLDNLRERRKTVGNVYGSLWENKYLHADVEKSFKLANLWHDASTGFDLARLRTLVLQSNTPDLALPMAMEYMRIGMEKSESIANLRKARDASRKWESLTAANRQRIDDSFQLALARQVVKDLKPATGKPNWSAIVKLCESDGALGWRAAAEAESRLDAKTAIGNLDVGGKDSPEDGTVSERRAFLAYLKAADKAAAGELAKTFQAKPLPEILNIPARKAFAARILSDGANANATFDGKIEDLLAGKGKPIGADPKALESLSVAYELDGANHPEWSIPLFFLADAAGNTALAQKAAEKVGVDLLTKNNGPLALAFLVKRASIRSASPAARIADRAAAIGLAQTLYEKETSKVDGERLKSFVKAAAVFAKAGLNESGGSNADSRALEFVLFRNDFLSASSFDKAWIDKARETIVPIANDLRARDPKYADALAYRSYVWLFRFHNSRPYGDLKKADGNEAAREREWNAMIADAEAALRADKDHPIAALVLSFAYYGMFNQPTLYDPPESRKKEFDLFKDGDRETVRKVAAYMKVATEGPRASGNFDQSETLLNLRLRTNFVFNAGNALARKGGDAGEVRALLRDAVASADAACKLRDPRRVDDWTLFGRVLEDLAWMGQENSTANFRKSIEMSRTGTGIAPSSATQRKEVVNGHMDMARAAVRGVMYGALDKAQLSIADDAWTAMAAANEKLSETERNQTVGILAEATYWKAMRKLVAGQTGEAATAFEAAESTLRTDHPGFYALGLLHRAEAILAGSGGREQIDAIATAVDAVVGKTGFESDYLLARKAVATADLETAKTKFDAAYSKIKDQWNQKKLINDSPFVLRCLASELASIKNLTATERADRKRLLKDLQAAYAWTLTPADMKLVADALN